MEGTVCAMDHQQVREAEVGRTNELSLMTIFPLMISTCGPDLEVVSGKIILSEHVQVFYLLSL
jgi:hypothetical protein